MGSKYSPSQNKVLILALFGLLGANTLMSHLHSPDSSISLSSDFDPKSGALHRHDTPPANDTSAGTYYGGVTPDGKLTNADTATAQGDGFKNCAGDEGDHCIQDYEVKSGKSEGTAHMYVDITEVKEDHKQPSTTPGYSATDSSDTWDVTAVIGVANCTGGCQKIETVHAKNSLDAVRKIAKLAEDQAKRMIEATEKARLSGEKQKKYAAAKAKLDKEVEACNMRDDGALDKDDLPVGVKLSGGEKLDCMKEHLETLSGKEAERYYAKMKPLLERMTNSKDASDREAASEITKSLMESDNAGISQAAAVLDREQYYQQQILDISSKLALNKNNSAMTQALVMQLRSVAMQGENDPVLHYGLSAEHPNATTLGAAEGQDARMALNKMAELAVLNPQSLAAADTNSFTAGLSDIPSLTSSLDQLTQQQQQALVRTGAFSTQGLNIKGRNLGVPVPGTPGTQVAGNSTLPAYGNPCYNGNLGCTASAYGLNGMSTANQLPQLASSVALF